MTKKIVSDNTEIENAQAEVEKLKAELSKLQKKEEPKKIRPRERNFDTEGRSLAFLDNVVIPGYKTYLATETKGNDMYRIQALLGIGYEFVTTAEIGITSLDGVPIESDKVIITSKSGVKHYFLKIPQEWYDDDLKKKQQRNLKNLKTAESPIGGFSGLTEGQAFINNG